MFNCDFNCDFMQCPDIPIGCEEMFLFFIDGGTTQNLVGKYKSGLCYPRITDLRTCLSDTPNFPNLCDRLDNPNYYTGCGPDCSLIPATGGTGGFTVGPNGFFGSGC